jgi:hypothetical protein
MLAEIAMPNVACAPTGFFVKYRRLRDCEGQARKTKPARNHSSQNYRGAPEFCLLPDEDYDDEIFAAFSAFTATEIVSEPDENSQAQRDSERPAQSQSRP